MQSAKAIATTLCITISLALFSGVAWGAERYTIDPIHSTVMFKVGHLEISYFRGLFTCFSGIVTVDRKAPENSGIEISVQTSSIDTNNDKRDEHLRSEDFFHAVKYPAISFKSTKVQKTGEKTFSVTGDFTLHGVTRQITVDAELIDEGKDMWDGYRIGLKSEFEIKRSDYGMTELIPAAGDRVTISLILEGVNNEVQPKDGD